MQKNTDSRQLKIRDARKSAWFYTLLCLIGPTLMLYLRWHYQLKGFLGVLLLVVSLLDLGLVVPVWISFKERIKEIEGGEEDAATEY